MGLEIAENIDELNEAWPLGSDPVAEADNHMRLIKRVIKSDLRQGYPLTRLKSFTLGATVFPNQVLYDDASAQYYYWKGVYPVLGYVVPPGSTPASSGGVGETAWLPVGDAGVTQLAIWELFKRSYAEAGYTVIGTFERGFTYTNATDIGLHEATGRAYTGPVGTVPAGTNPLVAPYVDVSKELLRTYKAPFTNAKTRSIPDRLSDRVSIRDFYVYGDGTEETTKIQQAVSEVLGAGRTLVVPPPLVGSHYICQDIQFPNTSWKMVGDGGPTIVQFATPDGVSNQNIFDLSNCNGPAKWLEGIGFGRLTAGSYDGIIGLLTNNTNGLHMIRPWFRGLARGFDMHGTFFEVDAPVFEYCATGINGLSNAKESIIRGTTYYKCEQDIIVPAGDNSTFVHVDSTHIGTKTRGVDIRGDNAYIGGVTARDDGTGYTPIIVRVTSGKANTIAGVTSTFGSDVVRVEGAASVGNIIESLVVPSNSNVQRGLFVSAASRTNLHGAEIAQSSIAAIRLDNAPDTDLHGANAAGVIGLSINACSQLRVYGGKLQGSTADTAQDAANSANPRFYGTRGNLAPITAATYI